MSQHRAQSLGKGQGRATAAVTPPAPLPLLISRNRPPPEDTCSDRPQQRLTDAVRARRWLGRKLAEVTGCAGPGGGRILGRG